MFTTPPIIQHPPIAGSPIIFASCQFVSMVILDNVEGYWLKNGHHKIPAKIQRTRASGKESDPVKIYYEFERLENKTSTYNDQGYYQCQVNVLGELAGKVLSTETDVQFEGIELLTKYNP